MDNLTQRQKIIIGCGVVFFITLLYIFLKYQTKSDIVINDDFKNQIEEANNKKAVESTEEVVEAKVPAEIFVYVCGSVIKPNVVSLVEGQRVFDAIQKTNGVLDEADINSINMARKVIDGEKIYIPKIGEVVQNNVIEETKDNTSNSNGLININTSNKSQLEQIPGVGPATATKIIEYREQHGFFKSIDAIKNVSGIGEKKFQALKKYITI